MKRLDGLIGKIYDMPGVRKWLLKSSVQNDMGRLHPGEDVNELCRQYYVDKLGKSIMIVAVGLGLALLLTYRSEGERRLEKNELQRGAAWDEAQTVKLETIVDGKKEQFEILISQRKLTESEAETCFGAFWNKIPDLIAGENTSINEVTTDLLLLENYEGYPFWIDWRSDNPECVSSSGTVTPGENSCEVTLRAIISYETMEWEKCLTVQVPAQVLTAEEQRHRELENLLLLTQKATETEDVWVLPSGWSGKALEWQRVVEDNSIFLWIAVPIVSVIVYFLGDKDLHQEIKKRQDKMRHSYPDIVHKLALYLGAGMTLQGAFGKVAAEYEEGRARGQPYNPAYEEMLYTCREMRSGISERIAYERFGLRIGLQEYIRLSTLMAQNLQKGSSSLLMRLQEEADHALISRIQSGRKLGEEASTKLLVPMVMLLGIVMVIVLLPAFNSMGL